VALSDLKAPERPQLQGAKITPIGPEAFCCDIYSWIQIINGPLNTKKLKLMVESENSTHFAIEQYVSMKKIIDIRVNVREMAHIFFQKFIKNQRKPFTSLNLQNVRNLVFFLRIKFKFAVKCIFPEKNSSLCNHIFGPFLPRLHSNFVFRQNGRNLFKNGRIRAV
jgi:hypothetical protein